MRRDLHCRASGPQQDVFICTAAWQICSTNDLYPFYDVVRILLSQDLCFFYKDYKIYPPVRYPSVHVYIWDGSLSVHVQCICIYWGASLGDVE